MKKILSYVLITAFCMSFAFVLPVSAAENAKIGKLMSDSYSVDIEKPTPVTFTLEVQSQKRLAYKDVKLCDESGNTVAYMHDDGKDGDAKADDGIYTAVCKFSENVLHTENYHAVINGKEYGSRPVKFRKNITDKDFDTAYAIWGKLEAIEYNLAEKWFSPEEIADAVYTWLTINESGNIASIKWENKRAFSFTLSTGIENYFEHFETEDMCQNAEQIKKAVDKISYIGQSSIGVWSPYYGFDSSFSYNYLNRAKAMQDVAGYETVESYYGREASVESFKNFDKYGVVMIDSHGADIGGGGYICIPAPGDYDRDDVTEGHIVLSGGTVCLRGTFMEKYCDTLPNSIVYIGICYGMAANNLYRPLIDHGAAFCCGYTDSVSFDFDGIQMDEFCMQLVKTNEATGLQNTAGDAFDKAIELHGEKDPYGDARFIYKGDRDVVASAAKITAESIAFYPDEITIYRNNEVKLLPVITPADANRYMLSWETSDEEIVSVDELGTVKALKSGEAIVKVTLTDTSEDEEKVLTAECRVIVDGDMAVSGIELAEHIIVLYEGMSLQIDSHVLPENASNQNVMYASSNDEVVKVDENGNLTPLAAGSAYITAKTEDGGFTDTAKIYVKEADLNAALNKANGTLLFATSGSEPMTETEGSRLYAATSNKSNSSSSSVTLTANEMKTGDALVFDRRVSSEADYDVFSFYVNGKKVYSVSGETGWETITYTAEKDGDYTFSWKYTKDYSTADGRDCGMLDEVDIIRQGETHTVTFYDMDRETVIETQTVAHGENAVLPEAPTHSGYSFLCWDGDYTNVRTDAMIYAEYVEKTEVYYTVTFLDMDGETVLAQIEVLEGEAAEAPETPEHKGYIFSGWDKDFSCVTEDMTVTALYNAVTFTVTFLDMDGETVLAEVKAEYGKSAEAPDVPEHEGYIFTGWDKDFSEVYGDMTVTAKYSIIGDVNCNGKINTADAVFILKYAAGVVTIDDIHLKIADVNKNSIVNTADATLILKYAAGMIEKF